MPRVRTGHLETYYQDIGSSKTKTLLLLHGWRNSWQSWAPFVPEWSKKYRLIIPDLPGVGQSDSPHAGWSMKQYREWLLTFLKEIGVDDLTAVVGHSAGGKLAAFTWLADHSLPKPPVYKGIFLIAASGVPRPLSLVRGLLAWFLRLLPNVVKRSFLKPLREWLYVRVLHETDYYSATPFQEQTLRYILSEDIRDVSRQQKDIPLHILWGEQDDAVPVWMAYEFAKLSSESDVVVLPQTGHHAHAEHPELAQKWLEAWL